MYLWLSWGTSVIICKEWNQPEWNEYVFNDGVFAGRQEHPFCLKLLSFLTFIFSCSDHGEMMEIQGFGGSPLSLQQADGTTNESLCQSCSMAGSNISFDYTAGCTCIHQPSDIHTYVLKTKLPTFLQLLKMCCCLLTFIYSRERFVFQGTEQYIVSSVAEKLTYSWKQKFTYTLFL